MLQQLVTLVLQLKHDAACDLDALRQRDRAIGQQLTHLRSQPLAQILAWLQQTQNSAQRLHIRQVDAARRLLLYLTMGIGLLLGSSTAAAVFYYDGNQPINVLPVLTVFVLLPLGLVCVWLCRLLLLTRFRTTAGRPGGQRLVSLWLTGLVTVLQRLLPQSYTEAVQLVLGQSKGYYALYGRVSTWILLTWSQVFAVCFTLGATSWFVFRLSTTDMAFAWSTTLDLAPQTIASLVNTLALPWQWLLPQATVDLETVITTRYFRASHGVLPPELPVATLGRWWPFLLAAILTYGLLPRLGTLALCLVQRRAALRWCLLHLPGVADILDRLNSPVVATTGPPTLSQPAATMSPPGHNVPTQRAFPVPSADSRGAPSMVLLNWGNVPLDANTISQSLADQCGMRLISTWDAGGANTPEADQRVLHTAVTALRDPTLTNGAVGLLVKAWEPPMLDVLDFLSDLRHAIGPGPRCLVLPMAASREAVTAGTYHHQCDIWQQKLATLGDPWLRVQPVTSCVAPLHAEEPTP